jgi:hypothetical protein
VVKRSGGFWKSFVTRLRDASQSLFSISNLETKIVGNAHGNSVRVLKKFCYHISRRLPIVRPYWSFLRLWLITDPIEFPLGAIFLMLPPESESIVDRKSNNHEVLTSRWIWELVSFEQYHQNVTVDLMSIVLPLSQKEISIFWEFTKIDFHSFILSLFLSAAFGWWIRFTLNFWHSAEICGFVDLQCLEEDDYE